MTSWIKVNTNDATRGSPSIVDYVVKFRGSLNKYVGGFSSFLSVQSSLYYDIMGVVVPIEYFKAVDYKHL